MLFTCNFSFEFCSRNLHSENDNAVIQQTPSSLVGTSNRATKSRMRAAVQGLEEEEESDEGEIEVVDFTDGKFHVYNCTPKICNKFKDNKIRILYPNCKKVLSS